MEGLMGNARQLADISWLFDTGALEISPADRPFWYTSGLIGPYYINTHFLCGGKQTALEVLDLIDTRSEARASFPEVMIDKLERVYDSHSVYRSTVDALLALAEEELFLGDIDMVSGGQRRDWFFSPIIARKLGKQCLYIYNDLTVIDQQGIELEDLSGVRVLNAADLLTVGSSYTKKWIPALQKINGSLLWSLNGVDRLQGGEKNLRDAGVLSVVSLFSIDLPMFDAALERKLIDQSQYELVKGYLEDPFASMQGFLRRNPQFLEDAQNSENEKTRARAELLVEQNLYQLR